MKMKISIVYDYKDIKDSDSRLEGDSNESK